MFWGYDATPIAGIAAKVKGVYQRLQPLDADPTMNFDERDLLHAAEHAGFRNIHLELEIDIKPIGEMPGAPVTWEAFMQTAGNPRIPTFEEAVAKVLTAGEAARFARHLRPLVEAQAGIYRSAVAYLSATK